MANAYAPTDSPARPRGGQVAQRVGVPVVGALGGLDRREADPGPGHLRPVDARPVGVLIGSHIDAAPHARLGMRAGRPTARRWRGGPASSASSWGEWVAPTLYRLPGWPAPPGPARRWPSAAPALAGPASSAAVTAPPRAASAVAAAAPRPGQHGRSSERRRDAAMSIPSQHLPMLPRSGIRPAPQAIYHPFLTCPDGSPQWNTRRNYFRSGKLKRCITAVQPIWRNP